MMTSSRFSYFTVGLACTTLLLAGCDKDSGTPKAETGVFSIEMKNVVGNDALELNAGQYKTAAGDNFSVSTFKYYISNVQLKKTDNTIYSVPDTYFLVDQAVADSRVLSIKNVPAGDYTRLSFTVGVDSVRNKAGNFKGALDSNNGMWWAWSEEFINLKLEGNSPQSPRGGLVFHIAGFKGANGRNNTIRPVSLSFPGTTKLLIRPDHTPEIHLHADVLRLFGAPNLVRFSTLYNTMGGPESVKVADNITAGLFSVDHIHAN